VKPEVDAKQAKLWQYVFQLRNVPRFVRVLKLEKFISHGINLIMIKIMDTNLSQLRLLMLMFEPSGRDVCRVVECIVLLRSLLPANHRTNTKIRVQASKVILQKRNLIKFLIQSKP